MLPFKAHRRLADAWYVPDKIYRILLLVWNTRLQVPVFVMFSADRRELWFVDVQGVRNCTGTLWNLWLRTIVLSESLSLSTLRSERLSSLCSSMYVSCCKPQLVVWHSNAKDANDHGINTFPLAIQSGIHGQAKISWFEGKQVKWKGENKTRKIFWCAECLCVWTNI